MVYRQLTYRFHFLLRCICIAPVLLATSAYAQTGRDTLPTVVVSAIKYADVTSSPVPVQQLTKKEIGTLNSLSVADAVKYFSGVQVKDYGGVGGLKTVSLRSLGANHTGVMYDGILLSDAQGGQIDLGKLSLDNIGNISLYNAQPNELLLPARSFAYAGILSLRTQIPVYDPLKPLRIKASARAGSFGLVNPSILAQYHFNKNLYNSFSAEWLRSDGAYTFKAYEAGGGKAKRHNSDMNALRLEYDAGYVSPDSSSIRLKAYYYHSRRGLPGAINLYNAYSAQRLNEENFFIQSSWEKKKSTKSRLLLNGKYSYNYSFYNDPVFINAPPGLQNKFHQKEYYFSGAYSYDLSKMLSAAYSSDIAISTLRRRDDYVLDFPQPDRSMWLNNLAIKAVLPRIVLSGNILYSRYEDKVKTGPRAKKIDDISSSISLSYQPIAASPLRLRFFYKDIFRAPTFNDLYYTYVGNTGLKPEYARQYNAGVTYKLNTTGFLQSSVFTVDAYYNHVKDKIMAVPRQNLFQWTMLNIGSVQIKGADVSMQLYLREFSGIHISSGLTYTYQRAIDKTNKSSDLYNTQIPYTPEHSGSIQVNAAYGNFSAGYNVLLSGYRYRLGQPNQDNLVKEWATQDISFSYQLKASAYSSYRLLAELNNIFNKQYEVIKFYPMPRFNYRLGISAEF